jgi:cysteine desulfurase/selenocysteine lyase
VEFGWTNTANFGDYGVRDLTLRPDAGRYECGTLNTIGCYGLRAAMEFLMEVGIERIGPRVQALGDQIADGVQRLGYELLGERTSANGAGIVSFRKAGMESTEIVARLARERIVTAARAGWVRASPHFYITDGEIEKILGLL